MKFDRLTAVLLVVVAALVFPSVALWQRQSALEAHGGNLDRNQSLIAGQRVTATIASCEHLNGVPASIVKAEGASSSVVLSDRDRLWLRAYVERATLTVPKTCTIAALNLGELASIARRKP